MTAWSHVPSWGSLSLVLCSLWGFLSRETPPGQRPPSPYGKGRAVRILLECILVTARKRSLRRLCFYTCLSFCSHCLPQCMLGYTPPPAGTRHHPGKQTPPQEADTPSACWEIWATSGPYASYWNAYLFTFKFGFNCVTETLLTWPIHLHKHDHEEFSVGSPWGLFTQVGIANREKVVTDVPPRSVLTVFSFCFAVTQLYVFM